MKKCYDGHICYKNITCNECLKKMANQFNPYGDDLI